MVLLVFVYQLPVYSPNLLNKLKPKKTYLYLAYFLQNVGLEVGHNFVKHWESDSTWKAHQKLLVSTVHQCLNGKLDKLLFGLIGDDFERVTQPQLVPSNICASILNKSQNKK